MSDEPETVRAFEGHVYVVGFESGVIKVGHTGNPKGRLASYVKDGKIHGNAVVESWVSPPHVGSWSNEKLLIDFCATRASLATGGDHGEYFTGIDFRTVRDYAETLEYPRFDPANPQVVGGGNPDALKQHLEGWFRLDLRRFALPPLVTELDTTPGPERDEVDAGWAKALGLPPDCMPFVRAHCGQLLDAYMLEIVNLKRDAEYLSELAQQAQRSLEERTTTGWAEVGSEILQAMRRWGSEAG